MTRIFPLLTVILVSSVMFAIGGEAKVPSLLGKWGSVYTVSFLGEPANFDSSLVITRKKGADFSAVMTWRNLDTGRAEEEAFAGTMDYDGKSFVIEQ